MDARLKDMAGMRFGKLVVIERAPNVPSGKRTATAWLCECDCGNRKVIRASNLVQGSSRSCGCMQRRSGTDSSRYKHGGRWTPLYSVWRHMRQRCNNPKSRDYKWYGGKGVSVTPEWNDFDVFRTWAYASGYEEGLSIDRINPDGNYTPENCRWLSIQDQQRNKTSNHILTYKGESHPMSVWSRILKISYSTLKSKVYAGWSMEEIAEYAESSLKEGA